MKLKKIIGFALAAAFAICALASCSDWSEMGVGSKLTYLSLRINPEVEMIADENGKIVSASAVNEDGEIVLSMLELEGMDAEEASVEFTKAAEEMGYFDPEKGKDTVYIHAESEDGENSVIYENLNRKISDYFKNNGVNGKVSNETLEKYAEKAEKWAVSKGRAKLIMRVLDTNPELSDSDLLALDVKGLMELLKGERGGNKIAFALKEEYRASVEALKAEYARVFELSDEAEALREKLEGKLPAEEAEKVRTELEQKMAEYEPLHKEYKEKLEALKSEYKESSEKARIEYRQKAEKKRNENKQKNENKKQTGQNNGGKPEK